jgi:outer membrane biosynthesis protein TonB
MTRLQKKCLLGSAFFHGLTVVVFLATAAFRSAPSITEAQVLNLIPATILDRLDSGGQPAPAIVTPQPSPPAIQPAPPKPLLQPPPAAPPKTVAATPPRQPETKPAPPKPGPTPAPARRSSKTDKTPPNPSPKPPSRNTVSSDQARAAAQAAAQTANNKQMLQDIASAFAALASNVQSKAASNVVAVPGEGGGEAFVSYRTAIFNAYYQAWKTPEGTTRSLAVADVRIVVSRNGDIISSEFVSKSGDPSVDQSVQRALDQVERQKLPPFPTGAEDTQRAFIIRFNLETKQSAG